MVRVSYGRIKLREVFLEKMTKIPKISMAVARHSVRKWQNVWRTPGPVEKTAGFKPASGVSAPWAKDMK